MYIFFKNKNSLCFNKGIYFILQLTVGYFHQKVGFTNVAVAGNFPGVGARMWWHAS